MSFAVPIEARLLRDAPIYLDTCPRCGATPFEPFLRGQIQRKPWTAPWAWFQSWRTGTPFTYCAIICSICHEIVGHESPPLPLKGTRRGDVEPPER